MFGIASAYSTFLRFLVFGILYRISNEVYQYSTQRVYSLNTYCRSIMRVRVAERHMAVVSLGMHAHTFARNIYTRSIL